MELLDGPDGCQSRGKSAFNRHICCKWVRFVRLDGPAISWLSFREDRSTTRAKVLHFFWRRRFLLTKICKGVDAVGEVAAVAEGISCPVVLGVEFSGAGRNFVALSAAGVFRLENAVFTALLKRFFFGGGL